ncbi:unnamed protein product [Effrenium voratum]|nr:unnamed protein product [Effrenium voratum]
MARAVPQWLRGQSPFTRRCRVSRAMAKAKLVAARGGEEARDVRGESPLARLKERYVQERMERLQKLCLFKIRSMQAAAQLVHLVLQKWRQAIRTSSLEQRIRSREGRTLLQKALTCLAILTRWVRNSRMINKKRREGLVRWALCALTAWCGAKASDRQRAAAHRRSVAELRTRRGLGLWQQRALRSQRRREEEDGVAAALRHRLLRGALRRLRGWRLWRLAARRLDLRLARRRAARALAAMRQSGARARSGEAAAGAQRRALARRSLGRWALAFRGLRTRLAQAGVQLEARRLVILWLHDCAASEVFCRWHRAAMFQRKETEASALASSFRWRGLAASLAAWGKAARALRSEHQVRRGRLLLLRARHVWTAWRTKVARTRRVQQHRAAHEAALARRVCRQWRRRVVILQQLRLRALQRVLHLCAVAWVLWRALLRLLRLERSWRLEVFGAWAAWAALRRQVRDDAAWQRWAEGVADLVISRRLLLLLPPCFAGWRGAARHSRHLAACLGLLCASRDRKLLRSCFLALRRLLAVTIFGRGELFVCRALARRGLRRFQRTCEIWAKSDLVAAERRRSFGGHVFQALHQLVQHRRAARLLAGVLARHVTGRCLAKLRRLHSQMRAAAAEALQAQRRRWLSHAWRAWIEGLRQSFLARLPELLAAWRRVCRCGKLRRRCDRRQGLCCWKVYVQQRAQERRRKVLAQLLSTRRCLRRVLLPWQLFAAEAGGNSEALERLQERWVDAEVVPGLQQIGFMRYRGTSAHG